MAQSFISVTRAGEARQLLLKCSSDLQSNLCSAVLHNKSIYLIKDSGRRLAYCRPSLRGTMELVVILFNFKSV